MKHSTWLVVAVVLGVAFIGYMIVNSSSVKIGNASSNQGTLQSVATIFKSGASILGDVEKAVPSWFDNTPTPTDSSLNSYASSSGFASTPDVSS